MPFSHLFLSCSNPCKEQELGNRLYALGRSLDKSIMVTPNAESKERTIPVNTQANRKIPTQGAKVITRAAKAWIAIMNSATSNDSKSVLMVLPFCVAVIIALRRNL